MKKKREKAIDKEITWGGGGSLNTESEKRAGYLLGKHIEKQVDRDRDRQTDR